MSNYRQAFLKTCIENQILRFGEFTLKSGRTSPYFFNAGLFNTGQLLGELAGYYAQLIAREIHGEFMLYGPAYKGIPLVAATAVQFAQLQNRNVAYAFNRKEAKDHGEGGVIVGSELSGEVIILDDVITAGTSANESVEIINAAGANPCAIVIALDRQEVADGETMSAVQKVEEEHRIPVLPLIKLDDLVAYLQRREDLNEYYIAIYNYRKTYGCS